jgi:hypothetical protein
MSEKQSKASPSEGDQKDKAVDKASPTPRAEGEAGGAEGEAGGAQGEAGGAEGDGGDGSTDDAEILAVKQRVRDALADVSLGTMQQALAEILADLMI